MPGERILVVDDHPEMVRLLQDQLGDEGYAVVVATGGAEAIERLKAGAFDLVLTDLRMEQVDGLDVLKAAHAQDPQLPVLVMTAFGGIDSAVEAMKLGAWHYLAKPFRLEEVRLLVQRALEGRRLRDEHRALRQADRRRAGLGQMVGSSRPMQELFARIQRVAQSGLPVLLRGESGTGKELVARAVHDEGPRAQAPFVPVNCTALPASLLESELFGHLKGAFTGATTARRGLFVEAHGGTLFLDEIGDMPADLQARLLRVLEDGEIRPVGSDGARKVDVRVIAATHQDLAERVRDGRFRQDLLFRLDVASLQLPPLRERPEDLPLLARHFLARAREAHPGAKVRALADSLLARLATLSWPGNVRELEHLVDRLVLFGDAEVATVEQLEKVAPNLVPAPVRFGGPGDPIVPLRQLEAEYIAWVVGRCGGNKTRAAELLGIDVSTIHRRERERS